MGELHSMEWRELAAKAETGWVGQSAVVEAMRRLDASSSRLATIGNRLSAVMAILAVVQVGLALAQFFVR